MERRWLKPLVVVVPLLIGTAICLIKATSQRGCATVSGPSMPPMEAAIRRHDLAEVDRLLKAGADPNLTVVGIAPVSRAYSLGDVPIMERLVQAGANPNTRGPAGDTPITSLLIVGTPAVHIQKLIEAGASLTLRGADGHTPLEAAAAGGMPEHIEQLLNAHVPFGPPEQHSALRWAVTFDKVDNVRCILKHGVNPDVPDAEGLTVLQKFAGSPGRLKSISILVDAGADVNRKDQFGTTPIGTARNNSNGDMLDLLTRRMQKIGLEAKQ